MGCAQRKSNHSGKFVEMLSLSKQQNSLNQSASNLGSHLEDILSKHTSSDAKTAKRVEKSKTSSDLSLINSSLKSSTLFNSLSPAEISKISESMILLQVKQGDLIIEQNKPGHMFFIISQGTVEVIIDGKRINFLKTGDCFGELALIQNSLRTSSIIAISDALLWTITRSNFNSLLTQITISNYAENKEFIKKIPVFADMEEKQIDSLVKSIVQMKFPQNSKIVGINQKGESMFIVKEGTASCVIRGTEKRRIHKGDYFGEISILNSAPRNATVIALNEVTCLMISRTVLNTVFEGNFQKVLYNNLILECLKKEKYFCLLSENQLKTLASEFKIIQLRDEVAIEKGSDLSSNLWIFLRGDFRKGGNLVEKLTFLGVEENWRGNHPELDDHIVADGECDLGVIDSESIKKILDTENQSVEELVEISEYLKKIPFLVECGLEVIHSLSKKNIVKVFTIGELVMKKDEEAQKFFILKRGKIRVDGKKVLECPGIVFGEVEIIIDKKFKENVECLETSEFWIFEKVVILSLIQPDLLEIIKSRLEFKCCEINSKSLKIIKKLSQTGEKIEFLAENSEKKLVKVTSISRNLVIHPYKKYLVEELQVLQIVDHFLIPQYLSYEKNDLGILIFSEYTSGNLLLKHLQSQGHNFEYLYKFYFACLVDIVAYLSENHVVLRNMTSESFIIDSDGYAVLNDLALSKIVHDRTHTILGNPYYLPPEAITEKGINSSSMFWIIGVILYEMICRVVPFGDKDDDPYSIYEKILRKRLIYNDFADEFFESKRIIEQLLCKNPDSRMIGGPQKFKLQSYFSCIDWNLFRLKKVKPPVSPSILVQNAISSEEVELFPLKDADFLPDWHEGF